MDTLPSVELIITLFPEADLPNSFEISTMIVKILPFNFISQFFIAIPPFINLTLNFGTGPEFFTQFCTLSHSFLIVLLSFKYPVSYTHLRAHETDSYLVCRLLLEKKKT